MTANDSTRIIPAGGRGDGHPDRNPDVEGSLVQRIGRYRILRELGRGGQAVVYLAQDDDLQRKAALKVLHGVDVSGAALVKRLEREATITSKLQHPGIRR